MTKNLTEGDPASLIWHFTLPLIAGNIFQQLYAFVDTLIVGRWLGVHALAAVGCTGCLMFLLIGPTVLPWSWDNGSVREMKRASAAVRPPVWRPV